MPAYGTSGPRSDGYYRCCDCKFWKEPAAFHKNGGTRRGLSSRCRDCHAIYVRRPETRERNREYGARRVAEGKVKDALDLVRSLRDVPCTDCGQRFPLYCMEFDHVDRTQKVANVSQMVGGGITPRLLEELAKCQAVCACCHRIRTRERDGIIPWGRKSKGRPRKAVGEW